MRRTGISVMIIICLTFLNPLIPQSNAKMSVISPEDMIGESDHIVVGVIKNRNYTEHHREVTISIDIVLKGEINQNQIVLKQDVDAMHGFVTFEFPKVGNKVMVLLRNTMNGYFPTYANSVCIINNNRVNLFEGMGFWSNDVQWLPKDYEKTYQTFYENSPSLRFNSL